jgi:hypothetical protein
MTNNPEQMGKRVKVWEASIQDPGIPNRLRELGKHLLLQ